MRHNKSAKGIYRVVHIALTIVLCCSIAGCYSFYVDRSSRDIVITSQPEGAYVWDYSGTKLLGQTPLQLKMTTTDYTLSRVYLSYPGYHDESVQIFDNNSGVGFIVLDAIFVLPMFVDLITLSPNYGKFKETNFTVNMVSTSIPRPTALSMYQRQQDIARAQAMAVAAQNIANSISTASAAMTQPQQQVFAMQQPQHYNTGDSPASNQPATSAKTFSNNRSCDRHGIEYNLATGCPMCKAPKFGLDWEVKCTRCGYWHVSGNRCHICK